ncbi:MAG: acetyl-CoA carboxylase, biotin carboxyl carrier protein [Holosporales bacterium]|jgi:acetyl-CoA carboxylase biotin carboxyl carrier protein|nr:acetyl-CoA carboxylase, biotin carboxyl carrier protein [Holosporales bacterium]
MLDKEFQQQTIINESDNSKEENIVKEEQVKIDELAEKLIKYQLTEIEYEENGRRIYISKKSLTSSITEPMIVSQNVTSPAVTSSESKLLLSEPDFSTHLGTIRSPMVGIVYLAPESGAASFVKIGDTVNIGQTLLVVEAMKVLNPIKATKAGKIIAILVSDQKPVEYDEPLIVID